MHLTRLTWFAAAALTLGCGEGRAIFNVDILSYKPELADTVPYLLPAGASITQVRDSFELRLPSGLGNATVDSVSVRYGSTVLNATGSGKFRLQVFFSSDSNTIFSSPVTFVDSAIVAGVDTKPLGPITVPLFADSLFAHDRLWVGVRASLVANSPGPSLTGRFVTVSVLRLRIVLQDHLLQ